MAAPWNVEEPTESRTNALLLSRRGGVALESSGLRGATESDDWQMLALAEMIDDEIQPVAAGGPSPFVMLVAATPRAKVREKWAREIAWTTDERMRLGQPLGRGTARWIAVPNMRDLQWNGVEAGYRFETV